MVAKFDDVDVQAGVVRLRRLFGSGAVEEAKRQAARYRPETWGAQWWAALSRTLERGRSLPLSREPGASIVTSEGSGWSAAEEYSERP